MDFESTIKNGQNIIAGKQREKKPLVGSLFALLLLLIFFGNDYLFVDSSSDAAVANIVQGEYVGQWWRAGK